MCQTSEQHRRIYQDLAGSCLPGALSPPWHRFQVDDDCRRLPPDIDEILTQLRRAFADQDLVAAGVARRGDDGEVRLAETLSNPGGDIIFLRRWPCDPFEIVTSNGLISGRNLPMFAARYDHHTVAALREFDGMLLLAFSMATCVLLRSLGLPVVFATGLDDLNPEQVCILEGMLGSGTLPDGAREPQAETAGDAVPDTGDHGCAEGDASANPDVLQASSLICSTSTNIQSQFCTAAALAHLDQETDGTVPVQAVILVAWEPAALELHMPPGVASLVQFLASAERHLGIDLSACGTWVPSEDDLEALQFCLRHGNNDRIRSILLESIEERTFTLCNTIDGHIGPPLVSDDYVSAQADLRRCLDARGRDDGEHGAPEAEQLARVIARHEATIERHLVVPLVEEAMALSNPLLRNLRVTAANGFRTIHRNAPHVDMRRVEERRCYGEAIRTQVNLINSVLRLVREIRREK